MQYPHDVTFHAKATSAYDPVTRRVTDPGAGAAAWTGYADVQDHGKRWTRDDAGQPVADYDLTIYVPEAAESTVLGVLFEGQDVTTPFGAARVVGWRALDGSIRCRYTR